MTVIAEVTPTASRASRSTAAAPATRAPGPRSASSAMAVSCERVFGTDVARGPHACPSWGSAGSAASSPACWPRRAPSSRSPTSTQSKRALAERARRDLDRPGLRADRRGRRRRAVRPGRRSSTTTPCPSCAAASIAGAANNQLADDAIADDARRAGDRVGAGLRRQRRRDHQHLGRARARGVRRGARRDPRARHRRHRARSSTTPTSPARRRSPPPWRSRAAASPRPPGRLARRLSAPCGRGRGAGERQPRLGREAVRPPTQRPCRVSGAIDPEVDTIGLSVDLSASAGPTRRSRSRAGPTHPLDAGR